MQYRLSFPILTHYQTHSAGAQNRVGSQSEPSTHEKPLNIVGQSGSSITTPKNARKLSATRIDPRRLSARVGSP